jgi:hypothetical protein
VAIGLALSAVVLASLTGCGGSGATNGKSSGQLVVLSDGWNGLGRSNTPVGKDLTFATNMLCQRGGPAQISSVHLNSASHMRFVQWAVRRWPQPKGELDNHYGLATDLHGFTQGPVREPCSNKNFSTEIDVTVKTTAPIGELDGFTVNYRDDQAHVFVPYRVILCQHTCPPSLVRKPLP